MSTVHKRYNLYYPSGTPRLQMRREIHHSSIDGQPFPWKTPVAYKNELLVLRACPAFTDKKYTWWPTQRQYIK